MALDRFFFALSVLANTIKGQLPKVKDFDTYEYLMHGFQVLDTLWHHLLVICSRWRDASIVNEMQYAGSLQLLKEMFDRNVGDGTWVLLCHFLFPFFKQLYCILWHILLLIVVVLIKISYNSWCRKVHKIFFNSLRVNFLKSFSHRLFSFLSHSVFPLSALGEADVPWRNWSCYWAGCVGRQWRSWTYCIDGTLSAATFAWTMLCKSILIFIYV